MTNDPQAAVRDTAFQGAAGALDCSGFPLPGPLRASPGARTIPHMTSGRALFGARLAAALFAAGALVLPASSTAAPATASSVTVSNFKLSASWAKSWLTASVKFTISCRVEVRAYQHSVRPVAPGPVAAHKVYTLSSGSTTETIPLPPRLVPREYTLNVTGAPATKFTIPTPPEGVVDIAAISTTQGGKPVTSVPNAKVLWARFHFLAAPSTKTVTIVWKTPGFKYVGKVNKPYTSTVQSDLSASQQMAPGTYYAYLKVGTKITFAKEVHVT